MEPWKDPPFLRTVNHLFLWAIYTIIPSRFGHHQRGFAPGTASHRPAAQRECGLAGDAAGGPGGWVKPQEELIKNQHDIVISHLNKG